VLRPLLVALLLSPVASAWSVTLHAPAEAGAGLPYLVEACVDRPGELRLEPARYAPVEAGCSTLAASGADLTARLRPAGGGSAKAAASARVSLVDSPLASVAAAGNASLVGRDGDIILRVPVVEGTALLPLLPGAAGWRDDTGDHALPPPDRPALVEVRQGAAILRNDGAGPLRLAGRALGAPLPDITLAPGETFEAKAPRHGPWTLRAAGRVEAALEGPAPGPGEALRAEGIVRLGRTAEDGAPLEIEGAIALFATPDAGAAPVVSLLDGARREVLVEAYTLTSPDVAAALSRALARGVEVRALLEGAPVGGRPAEEPGIVSALVARGARVAWLGGAPGFPARYPTLHAKALVVDRERALISTDNLHAGSFPAVPGAGSTRGFGLVVENATFASRLAAVMDADMAPWPDVHPDAGDAPPADLAPGAGAAEGPLFRAEGAWNVSLVLSPDDGASNATLLRMIREARQRVDVEMLFADARFGDVPDPFLDALVDAARRGVEVRLLLDGRDDDGRNRADAERLSALAQREGLPLAARVDASGRTLHAKAVVADGSLYVGSMNWGRASATENREAGAILWNATEAAAWMRGRMEQDWAWRPPEKATPGAGAWAPLAVAALLSWRARGRDRRRS